MKSWGARMQSSAISYSLNPKPWVHNAPPALLWKIRSWPFQLQPVCIYYAHPKTYSHTPKRSHSATFCSALTCDWEALHTLFCVHSPCLLTGTLNSNSSQELARLSTVAASLPHPVHCSQVRGKGCTLRHTRNMVFRTVSKLEATCLNNPRDLPEAQLQGRFLFCHCTEAERMHSFNRSSAFVWIWTISLLQL